MDSVKTAVGLGGKKGESGEEPVSGEKGEGTTAHPFDAGNGDEAQGTLLTFVAFELQLSTVSTPRFPSFHLSGSSACVAPSV